MIKIKYKLKEKYNKIIYVFDWILAILLFISGFIVQNYSCLWFLFTIIWIIICVIKTSEIIKMGKRTVYKIKIYKTRMKQIVR